MLGAKVIFPDPQWRHFIDGTADSHPWGAQALAAALERWHAAPQRFPVSFGSMMQPEDFAESTAEQIGRLIPLQPLVGDLCDAPSGLKAQELLGRIGIRGVMTLVGIRTTEGSVDVVPPSIPVLLDAFDAPFHPSEPKGHQLTVGGRAWTKHAGRASDGWWGVNSGSEAEKNAKARHRVESILADRTWVNVHGLPDGSKEEYVAILEVRTREGYGARWVASDWSFRGFLEPQMAGGHEKKWRH
ncbi:unnamed protein product [Vitrella brassicaformis CCMP3155]|uniref:Uncharacterized protein n=1 Tax=Vitrella brassicaformis (strain CCMP3155) TaxID=1169540 RepID=A0A0G4EBN4_VITBC|nr:unnamed protein product [Vitrella brassicaformis CCMP3155]|eukprot:CEL93388.1 unnamed protein product [Vitrella brassicaformis CCMP3155]